MELIPEFIFIIKKIKLKIRYSKGLADSQFNVIINPKNKRVLERALWKTAPRVNL